MTDNALLQLMAQRDVEAYELLYDRYAHVVYGLIVQIVGERAVADAVFQETWEQLWQHAAAYQEWGLPRAKIFQIARQRSLDVVRGRKTRPPHPTIVGDGAASRAEPAHKSKEPSAQERCARQQVVQAVQALSAEQRACLEAAYFEGLSQRQIAEAMDIPIASVKSQLARGLTQLEYLLYSSTSEHNLRMSRLNGQS